MFLSLSSEITPPAIPEYIPDDLPCRSRPHEVSPDRATESEPQAQSWAAAAGQWSRDTGPRDDSPQEGNEPEKFLPELDNSIHKPR